MRLLARIKDWPRRRYLRRVQREGASSITVWRPGPYNQAPGPANSFAPAGWWPFTTQIKPAPSPKWWRFESK